MSRNAHFNRGIARLLARALPSAVLLAVMFAPLPAYPGEAGLPLPDPAARVIVVHDPEATDAFQPRFEPVRRMIERGIVGLTEKPTAREAWLSLVSTQDVIGIKVYSEPGPYSGTRPAVVEAIVRGLIAAGIPTNRIVIWDKRQIDLRLAGYFDISRRLGVEVAGSSDSGYDEETFYDTPLLGTLVWGDVEFGKKGEGVGRKSFVSRLLTARITKIISVTPLINHNQAGVCGHLVSLALGSVENTRRFEGDRNRLATAVPEIFALPILSERVALNVVDALVCQYAGEERSLLHYSTVLNELRFSRDPVALDVLSLRELQEQRQASDAPKSNPNPELYENASLLELGVSDPRKIHIIRNP